MLAAILNTIAHQTNSEKMQHELKAKMGPSECGRMGAVSRVAANVKRQIKVATYVFRVCMLDGARLCRPSSSSVLGMRKCVATRICYRWLE